MIPPPTRSGYTTTTEVPLYWAAWGPAGAPRLLVLHGGPGAHHDYLLPQMLRLAERHEVVFYDQRGGGRSRTDDRAPITWRTHADDLARVARELAPGPLSLIGYSWGGLLALLYAAEASDPAAPPDAGPRPARMVLIDPAPATSADRARFEAELARRQSGEHIARLRAALAASGLRERDPDAFRQRAFELSVAGYFADPERARDLTPFRIIGRVQQSVWHSLGDFDLLPRLRYVTAPTLVIHGREDPIPLDAARHIAAALARARLVALDGSGHVPYVEAPDALFDVVLRFLDETEAGTSD